MIARMSTLFVKTLREDPADAEVPSHRWMVRAGYIRRVAPGIYTWLPLGLRVLHKVTQIVREEMDRMGAQEVLLPALLPKEPYEISNRWTEYGETLFRLEDRKGAQMLLGPTHEEMFTTLVKDLCKSYKDLPVILYQIQTKYRDEARPRAGVLRGREFVMKDSYSFDMDPESLDRSYQRHREAYIRIFDRLGFDYVIVQAHSGAMGGSASEEFLAVSPNGEDTFVRSPGGFAANVEAVSRPLAESQPYDDVPQKVIYDTPDAGTIEDLVDLANRDFPRNDRPWQASDTLKNILFKLEFPDGHSEALAIGLPGDREVDEHRLEAAISPAVAVPFTDEDFEAYPDLVKGYIGPEALGCGQLAEDEPVPAGTVKYLVDPLVVEGTSWLTGANIAGKHVANLVMGRDFTPDGHLDVATLRDGDAAPDGSGPLSLARGIEMGHIFQLGTKYAEALGLKVLDSNGKLQVVTMGSYGIGVTRAVAVIAEANCDDKGLCWPRGLAPYDVMVVATGKGEQIAQAAEDLAEQLSACGLEVLLDDRKASPGVKFADSELIGIPTTVIVGKMLAEGSVEIRDRASGDKRAVSLDEAVDAIVETVHS